MFGFSAAVNLHENTKEMSTELEDKENDYQTSTRMHLAGWEYLMIQIQ